MCSFQIRVDGIPPPAENALLYETVTVVEGKPILRDMVFSPDHQYIYLLSDRQVNTPAEPLHDQSEKRSRDSSPFVCPFYFFFEFYSPKNTKLAWWWRTRSACLGHREHFILNVYTEISLWRSDTINVFALHHIFMG